MNKTDALTKLAALEAETAALRKIIEAPEPVKGLWKPGPKDDCFQVGDHGGVGEYCNYFTDTGARAIRQGTLFPSREIAEKASPLMARANKIIAAALQSDPEAGEWIKDDRWYAAMLTRDYPADAAKWKAQPITEGQYDSRLVFVHTREQAEIMANILNAEGLK